MDIANGSASNSYRCLSENTEINIDSIVAAVAGLKVRISRLREEIVAFKNESMISSTVAYNRSSPTPSGFNDSTKNGGNRTGARRNFKGDDSPGGTDLSARSSFAKRAREVKAANGAAVFKEDYRRDDRSIEDDERPNRSRASETYRESISGAEKSREETDEGLPGDAGDPGDVKVSRFADEKLRKLNEHRNKVVSDAGRNPVFTSKIRRKRISRGVQCVPIGRRGYAGRSCLSCFRSKSRRRSSTRQAVGKEASRNDKFDVGPRDETKKSPSTTITGDESRSVTKEEVKSRSALQIQCDTDTAKSEKFEGRIEGIIYGNDRKLLERTQNMHDDGELKDNDNPKCREVKINLLEKLWLRGALTRNDVSRTRENGSGHESQSRKEDIAGYTFANKRVNGACKRIGDNSQSVKIGDREMGRNNGRESATVSADSGSDVNKIKRRLDLCIAELNGIIGDACAIFGNRKSAAKNNG